ncbi:hypothetical protein SBRCBS47491_010101 [Sporothrix bragantina]|uniref:Uncharacterized protein n=1 Tax=Sporothrix bragantina TaxID=671064 RepID=A0ABP0D110_9PEZI
MDSTTITLRPPSAIANRLAGQVALITGAAGFIGLETTRRFLQEGARVVLIDLDEEKLARAKTALADISNVEENTLFVRADVTSEPETQAFVDQAVSHFGRLDSVFLSAGLSYSRTSILETDVDLYDKVMAVNCRSAFLGVKHCGRAMKSLGNGGSIILASSASGLRASRGMTAYSMAKFALRGIALTAANELGPYGIRLNTIHPSGVDSPMFESSWPEEERNAMLQNVPLRRWAQPNDIAAVITFLASNDAQYLTGGAYKVDGGSVYN